VSATGHPDPSILAGDATGGERDEYRAALEFLYERINYEQLPREQYSAAGFKLDRMQALLDLLGNPEQRFPAIHIAGTKGKGSTAAICAAVLESAGYRVGLFTSPHLTRFEERMRINGVEPSPPQVVSLVNDVAAAASSLAAEGPDRRPTFFEVTTAMAWRYFERAKADLVVLEVGLGGRLDATNICRPAATVITSISMDHTPLLGNTLAEIAREKAGIIKPHVPVLSGVTDEPAAGVIEQTAADVGAPLYKLGRDILCSDQLRESTAAPLAHWQARISTPWRDHPLLRIPLAGEHQVANTALALAAVDLVTRDSNRCSDSAIADGLRAVRWPLRIEVLRTSPLVIADAAHNPASMTALISTLRSVRARRRMAIFAAARDKDVAEMLRLAAGFFDRIVLTQFTNNPRATPIAELAACADAAGVEQMTVAESPLAAWQTTLADARPDDLICITGSFFLGAELRDIVLTNNSPVRPRLTPTHARHRSRSQVPVERFARRVARTIDPPRRPRRRGGPPGRRVLRASGSRLCCHRRSIPYADRRRTQCADVQGAAARR
jgi:dihydrofolate synthase/folylpolyglutamate synthase